MTAFWDIVLCNFVEVDQRFRGTLLTHSHDGGGSIASKMLVCFNETTCHCMPKGCQLVIFLQFPQQRTESMIFDIIWLQIQDM
jgi:hypothetical protein